MIVVTLVMSAIVIVISATKFRPLLLGVPIMLLGGWLFHSLSIEIAEGELRWFFGPGLIHKRVPLSEIVSAQPVRTNVLEGWGIRLSRYGWLYNVSGFDAVAIKLKNGKSFCLGTDEQEALLAALELRV